MNRLNRGYAVRSIDTIAHPDQPTPRQADPANAIGHAQPDRNRHPRSPSSAPAAIEEAAHRKNDPADLINIALERLVEGSYELPAFRTLNDMATTIRARANEEVFTTVLGRLGDVGVARLERLLVVGCRGKSEFNQLKRPAGRPSWSNFRAQLEHQRWADELGEARVWWQSVPPSKIADFAGRPHPG